METFYSKVLRVMNETSPKPTYKEACKILSQKSAASRRRKKESNFQPTPAQYQKKLEQMKLF